MFIGYSQESKGYKLYNPLSSKVVIGQDVKVYEDLCWNWKINKVKTSVMIVENSIPEDDASVQNVENSAIPSAEIAPMSGGFTIAETQEETINSHTPADKTPPRQVRLLRDLYKSCTFAM